MVKRARDVGHVDHVADGVRRSTTTTNDDDKNSTYITATDNTYKNK